MGNAKSTNSATSATVTYEEVDLQAVREDIFKIMASPQWDANSQLAGQDARVLIRLAWKVTGKSDEAVRSRVPSEDSGTDIIKTSSKGRRGSGDQGKSDEAVRSRLPSEDSGSEIAKVSSKTSSKGPRGRARMRDQGLKYLVNALGNAQEGQEATISPSKHFHSPSGLYSPSKYFAAENGQKDNGQKEADSADTSSTGTTSKEVEAFTRPRVNSVHSVDSVGSVASSVQADLETTEMIRELLEPVKERFPALSYSELWVQAAHCAIERAGGSSRQNSFESGMIGEQKDSL